jgi:RNA polymerase sigma-70 factor (sigma-E family)
VREAGTATEAPPTNDALRIAFDRHGGSLLRLCTLLTGRREEAEDLVQESFVRMAPKAGALDEEATWPYLRRIAVNLWKNRLRRLAVEGRVRGRRDLDPPSAASRFEDRDLMWGAVLRLPPRQRACVVLRYYEDLTERETAAVLGCSVGTVKSQSAKALARLGEALGDGD